MRSVTGIVVNFHTPQGTADAVASLRREGCSECIVVNNGGSVPGPLPESTRVLDPGTNLGFGRAINLAVQSAVGEFLLLLNSDAVLLPNAVQRALECLDDGHAIVGSMEIAADGRIVTHAADILTLGGELLAACVGRSAVSVLARSLAGDHRLLYRGPSVSGGCMAMRRTTFTNLGGFSEAFFMYYEDTDLCARALEAGHTICVLSDPLHRHANHGSPTLNDARRTMIASSLAVYLIRRFGKAGAATILMARIASSVLLMAAMRITGRRDTRAYWDKAEWLAEASAALRRLVGHRPALLGLPSGDVPASNP